MKQIELATQIQISVQALSNIVCGRRRPSWSMAKKLASATGTSPSWWMEAPPEQIRSVVKTAKGNGDAEAE